MSDSRPFGKMPISTSMVLSLKLQNIRTRSTSTDTTGNGMLAVTRFFKAMLLSGCIAIAGCACGPSSIDEELDKILADVGNQYAADTYDVIYAMKAAADAAEITPDMSNEDISAAMSEAMLSVELDGLTGKAKWTEDGECDKEPKAFEIQDGAYVEME